GFNVEKDLLKLGRKIERAGDVALVWVDGLVTTFGKDSNTSLYEDTYGVLGPLGKLAEQYGIAVMAPWHLNKAGEILGSIGFEAASRSIIAIERDEETQTALLGVVKMNGAADDAPALRFGLEQVSMPAVKTDPRTGAKVTVASSLSRVVWHGAVAGHPREVIGAARAAAKDFNAAPVVWLRGYLGENGPTPRDIVLGAGNEEGFSEGQLKRAYRRLNGVRYEKEFGGKAVWRLPDAKGGVPSDSLIELIGGEDKNTSKRLNASSQVTTNWVNEAIRSDTPPAAGTENRPSDAQLRKFGIEPAERRT